MYGRVKRALGKDTFVIVDGMNYIKGWRYQLWCESKAAETTCCVVCLEAAPPFLFALLHSWPIEKGSTVHVSGFDF